MLTVFAPAKVNLTLEVLAKRPDGFHEIRSLVQTIDLCDRLQFQAGDGVEFRCTDPNWLASESLVTRAANLIREQTGGSQGAVVTLDKHIPLLSGLGGDSSDAATVLRGLSQLWKLDLTHEKLIGLATELGSDVPFFLHGGTALLTGRGELVRPLPSLKQTWLVLMLPPVARAPGKTGRLYARIGSEHYTSGEATLRMADQIAGRGELPLSLVYNVFDRVAPDCFTRLSEYRERFLNSGASEVHLAGSGPALFTLSRDKAQAERIYKSLRKQGLEAYLASTSANIDYP
jgi:4-diphosphocytidyl-2-C-methyl-D-erythritol kinase